MTLLLLLLSSIWLQVNPAPAQGSTSTEQPPRRIATLPDMEGYRWLSENRLAIWPHYARDKYVQIVDPESGHVERTVPFKSVTRGGTFCPIVMQGGRWLAWLDHHVPLGEVMGWQAISTDGTGEVSHKTLTSILPGFIGEQNALGGRAGVCSDAEDLWFSLFGDNENPVLARFALNSTRETRVLPLPRMGRAGGHNNRPTLLARTADGRFLITTAAEGATKEVVLYEVSTSEPNEQQRNALLNPFHPFWRPVILPLNVIVQKRVFRLPKSAKLLDMAVSPSGDRLAWLLSSRPTSKAVQRMQAEMQHLWICGIEGADMREIRVMEAEGDFPPAHDSRRMTGLNWRPGGRSITYQRGDSVYELPVPSS